MFTFIYSVFYEYIVNVHDIAFILVKNLIQI